MVNLMKIAVLALLLALVLAMSGCIRQPTSAPKPTLAPTLEPTQQPLSTPIPSKTPTLPPAVNQSVEQQYQYVEKLQSGIDHYNTAISLMWDAHNKANNSQWVNASQQILAAKDQMDKAGVLFTDARGLGTNSKEVQLGELWYNTTYFAGVSYQYASEAYLESANQSGREHPNWIKHNSIVQQVNYYNSLSAQNRDQAEALANTMTLFRPE